ISIRSCCWVMFSRRLVFTTSTRGFSIGGGQAPMIVCHVQRISPRRRRQSSGVRTTAPSANSRGEREPPQSERCPGGGVKNSANSSGSFGRCTDGAIFCLAGGAISSAREDAAKADKHIAHEQSLLMFVLMLMSL